MDSSTIAIRVLMGSASAALIAALIVVGTISHAPEPKANPPIPASALPVPSGNQESRHPSPAYAALPVVKTRRTAIIDHCFTSDLDLTAPASPREIALIVAAFKADWESVRRMLDAGLSIESANAARITSLMVAASQGDASMTDELLRRHANANSKDLAGRSALCYAIRAGKLAAIQSLLPLVSDLETAPVEGHDLLTMALETGNLNIFQAVLERLPATLQWTASTRGALEA